MKVSKLNLVFRLLDFLLWPFMFILGGFKFPVQETHIWHMHKWIWNNDGLKITETDKKSKFSYNTPFSLAHMPIFGGWTRYVVIEASGFKKYWYVGWKNVLHFLPIYNNRIMMLTTDKGFTAYGLSDTGEYLKLKIIGYGELGDGKYKGIRLF